MFYYETKNNDKKITFSDMFDYILVEPEKYIKSKVDLKLKLNTLNMLMQYFEEEEDYLKCNELLIIKKNILINNNYN